MVTSRSCPATEAWCGSFKPRRALCGSCLWRGLRGLRRRRRPCVVISTAFSRAQGCHFLCGTGPLQNSTPAQESLVKQEGADEDIWPKVLESRRPWVETELRRDARGVRASGMGAAGRGASAKSETVNSKSQLQPPERQEPRAEM